jgi:hypothetical protein
LEYSEVIWQIDSIFESEMYSKLLSMWVHVFTRRQSIDYNKSLYINESLITVKETTARQLTKSEKRKNLASTFV